MAEYKICTKCNKKKPVEEYRKTKTGFGSICLRCEYEANSRRYYEKRMKDPAYVERKQLEEENAKLIKDGLRKCIVCKMVKPIEDYYFRKDLDDYRKWCKDCEKKRTRTYYHENQEEASIRQHQRYVRNRERYLAAKKEYAKTHKEQLRKYHTKYVFDRRKNDDIFHFKSQIRHLINQSFRRRGVQKRGKTEEIVGCDFETFNNYLLDTFKRNYGVEWDGIEEVHIDHIKPLSNANSEEEIIKLCHYTNLQLLKAKDNLEKNDKTDWNLK